MSSIILQLISGIKKTETPAPLAVFLKQHSTIRWTRPCQDQILALHND